MDMTFNGKENVNYGVQCQNYNYGLFLNGIQSEVVKSMDKLPKSEQAKILIKVYEMTEKYLTTSKKHDII